MKDNFSHVLEVIDKHLLQGLTIYPETNGTLLIDCTKREAGISLGDERFSYYEIDNGKVTGENGMITLYGLSKFIGATNTPSSLL